MRRKKKKKAPPPAFAVNEVLNWCDGWYERYRAWPKVYDGVILEAPLGTNWRKIDNALRVGLRGLPRG